VACGSQLTGREPVNPHSQFSQPTKLSEMQKYQSAQALDDLTKYGHVCTLTPMKNDFAVDAGQCATDIGQLKRSVSLTPVEGR
jgi:hypothetical protein